MCNAHLYERYDLKTPIHLSRHAIETVWPSFWYLNGDFIWRGISIGTDAFSIINILHGVLVWAKSTHGTVRGFLCEVLIKVQTDVTIQKCINVFYWKVNMRVSGCRQPCEAMRLKTTQILQRTQLNLSFKAWRCAVAPYTIVRYCGFIVFTCLPNGYLNGMILIEF